MDKPFKTEPFSTGKGASDARGVSVDAQKQPFQSRLSKPPPPPARVVSSQTAKVKGLRVLIIDDDPAKLDALATSLRELKVEVAVGSRVESGYSQAAKLMPDVVISDLVSPGERGWWLVQRLRRHPILRWTPFILLRWWEEEPLGEGRVLIDRILDRLEEALGPIRVLKERIENSRPLAGRVDTTGPQALLRTLTASRISGVLTVNDAWSIFEATLSGGGLRNILRRGMDGSVNEGEEALTQFLLCDTAKWSFRLEQKDKIPVNIDANLEKALGRAGRKIQDLLLRPKDGEIPMENLLRVRLDVLASADSVLSSVARRVAKAVGEGMTEAEIDVMLADIDDLFEVERAVHSLVRSGAILSLDKVFDGTRDEEERRAAASASYLLKRICEEQTISDETFARDDGAANKNHQGGQYKASNLPEERLAATMPGVLRGVNARVAPKTNDSGRVIDETPSLTESEADTTSVLDGPMDRGAIAGNKSDLSGEAGGKPEKGILKRLLHDSFMPMPFSPEKRGDKHMWLAIALALLFGGLVVAGLIYLASSSPSEPPAPSGEL